MIDEDWYHEYASGTMVAEELQIYPGPETPEGFEVAFPSRSTSEQPLPPSSSPPLSP